jgi:ribosomal protein L37AE/L43A
MGFILFFGTRQVVRDDDRPGGGPQQCPRCGQYAAMRPRRARTYFHLFWLPFVPLGPGEPIWECANCRARFAAQGVQ